MNNYPPGVTGNEFAIAGPDYEKESKQPCGTCGQATMEVGYGRDRWLVCQERLYTTWLPLEDKDDPDRKYDEERERRLCHEPQEE